MFLPLHKLKTNHSFLQFGLKQIEIGLTKRWGQLFCVVWVKEVKAYCSWHCVLQLAVLYQIYTQSMWSLVKMAQEKHYILSASPQTSQKGHFWTRDQCAFMCSSEDIQNCCSFWGKRLALGCRVGMLRDVWRVSHASFIRPFVVKIHWTAVIYFLSVEV